MFALPYQQMIDDRYIFKRKKNQQVEPPTPAPKLPSSDAHSHTSEEKLPTQKSETD
jgi:hypothetical protein